MSGLVYFFKHKETNAVKIGYTNKNDISSRFSSFCVSSPYGAEIIGLISTETPLSLEKKLHQKYKSLRLNGEFFELSDEKVRHIVNKYSTLSIKTDDFLLEIGNYLKEKSTAEANKIKSKIREVLYNSEPKSKSYEPLYMDFLNMYKNTGVNKIYVPFSEIHKKHFNNESARAVGLFLKENDFIQKSKRINGKLSRVYELYSQ